MCFGSTDTSDEHDPPARPVQRDDTRGNPRTRPQQPHYDPPRPKPASKQPALEEEERNTASAKLHSQPTHQKPPKVEVTAKPFVSSVPLTRQNLTHALRCAEVYFYNRLQRKGRTLTIVAMGDVARVLLQKGEKAQAKDIHLFGADLYGYEVWEIANAMEYAQNLTGVPLAKGYMDPDFLGKIGGHSRHEYLTHIAQQSAAPLAYKGRNLTVIAVPLHYSFIKEVNCLNTKKEQPTSVEQAVKYLYTICELAHKPLSVDLTERLCGKYRIPMPREETLRRVNGRYRLKYRCNGIDI